jgi:hypothetical protein
MTEAEWMGGTDPTPMLEFLGDRASQRKMRLFACACCRLIPGFLESPADRRNLEVTELDADGFAGEDPFVGLEDPWDIR